MSNEKTDIELSNKNQNNDEMATASIGKLLLKLAVPAIVAQVINALYNVVDRMYIGNMADVGAIALTGVGITMPIIVIITAFSALVGMGGAPKASAKLGEQDLKGAEKIVGNCLTMLIIISIILTTVIHFTMEPMLMMFGASADTISYAMDYLRIYVSGTIFVQLTMGMNAFITAQGFAKFSMCTVLIGAALNIILDPIFIFGFGMGVKGAAVATVISQAVSAIWVMKFLLGKKTRLKIRKENLKLEANIILPVIALGLSPFVMQSTESLVQITLNTNLRSLGGDTAVGAMTIISSITQMFLMPLMGITQGAQPILSYNFGAKNFDRVKKTFKIFMMATVTWTMIAWSVGMLMPQVLIRMFTNDPILTDMAVWAMRIFIAGTCMMGAQITCQQTFVSLGEAKISLFLAMLRKIILLIPLVFLFAYGLKWEVFGVLMAQPVADILAATTTILVFSIQFPKILRKAQGADPDYGSAVVE